MRRAFLLSCLLLLTAGLGFGQIANVTDQTSTPVPDSGHDYFHMLTETVNPANGSVSLRIRVPVPKGARAYDSVRLRVRF